MRRACLVVGFAIGVLAGGSARGVVTVYDTIGSATSPFDAGFNSAIGTLRGNVWEQARQFVPSQTVRATAVDVVIGRAFDGESGGQAVVSLRGDAGGVPGAVIESWTTGFINDTAGHVESMTPATLPTLVAGTPYWVTVGAAAGSALGGQWFAQQPGSGMAAYRHPGENWTTFTTDVYVQRTRIRGSYLPGDLNGNGKVDQDDYTILDRGRARAATDAESGDFNGDHVINSADYLIIDTVLKQQGGHFSAEDLAAREAEFGAGYVGALAAVPEPTLGSLLVACGGWVVGRRRGGRRRVAV